VGNYDSLSHIELIESIEEAFNFQMSAMEIAMLAPLGDAESIVSELSG
jgi:acyl carrier protein